MILRLVVTHIHQQHIRFTIFLTGWIMLKIYLRAADILKEHGLTFKGPGKHGISQAMYVYVVIQEADCVLNYLQMGI